MYFVRPVGKRHPYGVNIGPLGTPWLFMPPWNGPTEPAVRPGKDGHFDHLQPGTSDFEAAHLFGVTRFVLDVWEGYLNHPVRWHFARDYDRLELSILPGWDNGQIGYGYLEVGVRTGSGGVHLPYALSFDVIAHEVGHGLVYSVVGLPRPDEAGEYYGLQEAAADWVALTTALHIPSVVESLLNSTSGNLYTYNELNRFGEFSQNSQIRLASNYLKLSDFAAGWTDEHVLSQPLSGALFDIFVDIFHHVLVEIGAMSWGLQELADISRNATKHKAELQTEFDRSYRSNPSDFVYAIEEARDIISGLLVGAWREIHPGGVTYFKFANAMISADAALNGGKFASILIDSFRWRDIDKAAAGPRLATACRGHSHSARLAVPEFQSVFPRMTYKELHKLVHP